MKVSELFAGVRYVGKAEGDRKTYYIFEAHSGYIVVTPNSRTDYNMSIVDTEAPAGLRSTESQTPVAAASRCLPGVNTCTWQRFRISVTPRRSSAPASSVVAPNRPDSSQRDVTCHPSGRIIAGANRMAKSTNDALVQRRKELRATLIQKHSRLAAERIVRLTDAKKRLTVEQIAEVIAAEFLQSPV